MTCCDKSENAFSIINRLSEAVNGLYRYPYVVARLLCPKLERIASTGYRFCYDSYIPNELYVDVYLSDIYIKIGHPLFSFSYLPEDAKSEYNFLDDSEKYVLKIQ